MRNNLTPIIDLFAGAGGLAEGFSRAQRRGKPLYRVALSIEKDRNAHETLLLRAFARQFGGQLPVEYWAHLRGEISRSDLFDLHGQAAAVASAEARHHELGLATDSVTRSLVRDALRGYNGPWGVIGGPPCQAYSLVGRSRNLGNAEYVPEDDHRQTLYLEYLQIIADHVPTFFIMENVKGLLSATLASERLFERITEDLHNPARALKRENRRTPRGRPRYHLYPLSVPVESNASPKATDFIIRSEEHGIPQARHRVILLGVLEGVDVTRLKPLRLNEPQSVQEALRGLPKVRSGITDLHDSDEGWCSYLQSIPSRDWFREVDSAELKRRVQRTLKSIRSFPAGRGGEFIINEDVESNNAPAILNHSTRAHIALDLDRYFFLSCFGEEYGRSPVLKDFPEALLPDHKNARTGSKAHFSDRFRVQVGKKPATTITSHISKDGHYYVHPDPLQCRSFTVREAARLQTFADDYFFCGPRTSQYHQVGNAVPPELARQIAEAVSCLI